MSELVSEDDLTRARSDLAFRQPLMAENLEKLLAALNKMRRSANPTPETAAQLREGIELAVKLADRLQSAHNPSPRAA